MSVVSIHPEDLLDKLSRDELSPAEGELLEAHLSSCDVCRFELAVSIDLQNETRARSSTAGPPLGALPVGPERPQAEGRRSRRVIWAVAAAMLIVSTGAVASAPRVGQSVAALLRLGGAEPSAPAPVRSVALRPTASPAPALAQATSAPPVIEAPMASAEPALPSRPVVARAATPVAVSSERAEASSAETLFAAANQARRRGDLAEAGALYRDLQKKFPSSQEAGLSQVTLSMLLLDRGEAASALAGFDRYLSRSRRPLEAEALVGRARSLGALGSRSAEASAWRDVERRYPGSIYARQAKDRLSALDQR